MQNLELNINPGGTSDVLGNYVASKIQEGDSFVSDNASKMTGAAELFAAGTTDMAFDMMDTLMLDVMTKGVDAIYESLGINQETLLLTSKLVETAKTTTGIASDLASFIPMSKNSFPMVKTVLTEFLLLYVQVVMQPIIQTVIYTYYDLKNAVLMLDRDAVIELALAAGYEAMNFIIQLVDNLVFKYTGYTIMEIYYMGSKGFQKIAAYRRAKRFARELKSGDGQVNEQNHDLGIDININPEQIKLELIDWAMKQSDMLYNAFLLLTLRDMIMEVKETFQNLSNVGFENLADSVNSLDDFMNLLDELGIGEAPTISLDDIVNQGLSIVHAGVQTVNGLASMDTVNNFAGAASDAVINSTTVSINAKPSFDIKSESNENHGIDLKIVLHIDPNKKSVYRDMQETIKKIKFEKKSVFDNAKTKLIINNCITCWVNGSTSDFNVDGIAGDKHITYTISIKKDEYKEEIQQQEPKTEPYVPVEWTTIEEAWSQDSNIKSDKKPVVELLNMLIQLLMPMSKLLLIIAHLILNYRINKAFAKSQAGVALADALKGVMAAAGFIQDVLAQDINNALADGSNFYVIGTRYTYDWLVTNFNIKPDDHQTCRLTPPQTFKFCAYGKENGLLLWEQLNVTKPTVLFIDFEGIRTGRGRDGSANGVDNMLYLEDLHEVMFTDKMRPQMSSLILYCIKNSDKPNNIKK